MNIDGLFAKINEKNDIARATIRGRLSEMVRAGEVKKLASEKFKAIPVEQIVENHKKQAQKQEIENRKLALKDENQRIEVAEPLIAN